MRSRATDLRRRKPLEWGVRGVLAVAVLALGYIAVLRSAAMALPERSLAQAHELAPGDARIAADLARQQIVAQTADPSVQQLSGTVLVSRMAETKRLAQQALRRDATAIPAVTTLGMIAQLQGDVQDARRKFAYSESLSRRDLVTQLWLIEDAVGRNDIPAALRHYDTALRTKWGAWDLLFPLLAGASNDPMIAAELVKLLAKRPTWTNSFVTYLANNSSDPPATARLFIGLRRAGVPIGAEPQALVINALLAKRPDAAWAYYASVRPGADRRRSRDPDFTAMLDPASQLDWIPAASDTGLSASIQRAGQGAVFDFFAPASVGGALLQQIQLLPPGRYILQGRSSGINQPDEAQPYWVLTCTNDGRELGRVAVPNSDQHDGTFSGYLTVPADCSSQYLALMARASNAIEGLSGQIERVQLRPVQ